MESTLIRGSIRVVEESCAFSRLKKSAFLGEGWTHFEVNSNDGVNSNNGAILKSAVNSNNRYGRSGGSCVYICSRVVLALLPR